MEPSFFRAPCQPEGWMHYLKMDGPLTYYLAM